MTQIIANNNGGGGGGGGASYTAGTGIDITSNKISIDEDVVQTKDNLVTSLSGADDTHYPSAKAVADAISGGGLGDVIGPNSSTDGDIAVFDGITGKLIKDSGIAIGDISGNTKTFKITGTTGSSNLAVAQEAYDRYVAGKYPLISYSGRIFIPKSASATSMSFYSQIDYSITSANGYTTERGALITITISSGTVTTIDISYKNLSVLAADTKYSTPYTPEYDGSPANKKYVNDEDTKIISRGENLVTNGFATLGNSYNFYLVQFSGDDTYGAGGCFQYTSDRNFTPTTTEYMQVDITQTYKLSYAVKNSNTTATYDFIYMYDIDKNLINTGNVTRTANTTTTLAQELKDGDTVVYLTDTSNFNTTDGNAYRTGLIFWNYQNSYGYQYPVETYSRNRWYNLWADSSTAVDKVNNTITLSSPRNHGTFPAGTSVSQSAPSGGNIYGNGNYTTTPGEWTYKEAFFTPDKFRTATSYVRLGWLLNYSKVANTTVKLSSISFTQNVSFEDIGNTTVYTLASASDLSTAQKIYDEYQTGRNVVVQFSGNIFAVNNVSSARMNFNGMKDGVTTNRAQGDTAIQTTAMYFGLNNGTVTSINGPSNNSYIYTLATNQNYATPYTPQYPGSPATKKYVDDAVANLMAMGKFLSLWNCATGQPISFPLDTPYTYHTGDYYMVETVSTATPPVNYKPNGSSYTGTASTTIDSDEVAKGDFYVYDGTVWLLATNHGKTVSFANLAGSPSDNTALSNALSLKQDNLATQTAYTSQGTSTKVPIITTNSLGQVTAITETSIEGLVPSGGSMGQVLTQTSGGTPIWQTPSGGIENVTTGTTSTVTGIWAGTEAEYGNISTPSNSVLYFTF